LPAATVQQHRGDRLAAGLDRPRAERAAEILEQVRSGHQTHRRIENIAGGQGRSDKRDVDREQHQRQAGDQHRMREPGAASRGHHHA
jgi:hypothetical protein